MEVILDEASMGESTLASELKNMSSNLLNLSGVLDLMVP